MTPDTPMKEETMTEPRTEAGRALVAASKAATNKSRIRPVLVHEVAAIEAEARADALREAADRVRALRGHDQLPGYDNTEQRWVDRAAVLAILDPDPQP